MLIDLRDRVKVYETEAQSPRVCHNCGGTIHAYDTMTVIEQENNTGVYVIELCAECGKPYLEGIYRVGYPEGTIFNEDVRKEIQRLHDYYCPDYIPDWNDVKEYKYLIHYNYDQKWFVYDCENIANVDGEIYFPSAVIAKKVCRKLNFNDVLKLRNV